MELHPVDYLFSRLEAEFVSYPPGVVRVPKLIPGTAFFPGGYGLWGAGPEKPLPAIPTGGVMVLGHNFDSEKGFSDSLERRGENLNGPTWGNLLPVLELGGIPREKCFFTNFYMGLVEGADAVGRFPGARDSHFVQQCQIFLGEQMRVVKPRLLLTLGKEILRPVATPRLSSDLGSWSEMESLEMLDRRKRALVYPATFPGVPHSVAVVALTHPAFRHLNVPRRRYKTFSGDAAEQAMLKDALDRLSM